MSIDNIDVLHGNDSVDDRDKHYRTYDELDQVEEYRTERFDVLACKGSTICSEDHSDDYRKHKRDENLECQ